MVMIVRPSNTAHVRLPDVICVLFAVPEEDARSRRESQLLCFCHFSPSPSRSRSRLVSSRLISSIGSQATPFVLLYGPNASERTLTSEQGNARVHAAVANSYASCPPASRSSASGPPQVTSGVRTESLCMRSARTLKSDQSDRSDFQTFSDRSEFQTLPTLPYPSDSQTLSRTSADIRSCQTKSEIQTSQTSLKRLVSFFGTLLSLLGQCPCGRPP
jgi:hypothetical protein